MEPFTLRYRHNDAPNRGLAAAGAIFFVPKLILALPHLLIVSVLGNVATLLAYIGYWIVAFTGKMPQATHRLIELNFNWSTRASAWLFGLDDVYPPFETDPVYSASFPVSRPMEPSKGWAVAGLLWIPKFFVLIPHFVVLAFVMIGGFFALWWGYIVTALTGNYPTGIQDFLAGIMQWGLRVQAFLWGLTDDYPPFSLTASPTA
jgi:hypothetical protein